MWNKTHWYFSTVSAKQREIREFSPILKENFRAAISEGKSWQMESPKILMLFRESPHQLSGKSPCKHLSNHVLRTKLPHIEFNSNTALLALDRKHWSRCNLYQARFKEYHGSRQRANLLHRSSENEQGLEKEPRQQRVSHGRGL